MGGREDHNFLLLTRLITCIEFRNYLPPPNPREVKMFKRTAPEAQSYLILIHILLAFGLLVSKVTENGVQTEKCRGTMVNGARAGLAWWLSL